MTTMIYHADDGEKRKEYCGVMCGYKIVEDNEVDKYLKDGWATHPSQLNAAAEPEPEEPSAEVIAEAAAETEEIDLSDVEQTKTEIAENE